MSNEQLDTIQFRRQYQEILNQQEAVVGHPNNLRNLLFASVGAMKRQIAYLSPIVERLGNRVTTLNRSAARLENGLEMSDSEEHKNGIEEARLEAEFQLNDFMNQLDECLLVLDLTEQMHDRIVIETGKGNLVAEIEAKAEKKRAENARRLEAAERLLKKQNDEKADAAHAESETMQRLARFKTRISAAA